MKRLLAVYRSSPIAGPMVLVLAAAIALLAVGPEHDRTPAIVVIAIVVAITLVRAVPHR